jgi:anti-anti-sigma regulatory factor
MLRITLVAAPAEPIVLKLEGNVDREGGALLERECASWISGGAAIALDLSAVRFVDRAGTAALGRLRRAGVEIRCGCGVVASVLECEGIDVVNGPSGDERP